MNAFPVIHMLWHVALLSIQLLEKIFCDGVDLVANPFKISESNFKAFFIRVDQYHQNSYSEVKPHVCMHIIFSWLSMVSCIPL